MFRCGCQAVARSLCTRLAAMLLPQPGALPAASRTSFDSLLTRYRGLPGTGFRGGLFPSFPPLSPVFTPRLSLLFAVMLYGCIRKRVTMSFYISAERPAPIEVAQFRPIVNRKLSMDVMYGVCDMHEAVSRASSRLCATPSRANWYAIDQFRFGTQSHGVPGACGPSFEIRAQIPAFRHRRASGFSMSASPEEAQAGDM